MVAMDDFNLNKELERKIKAAQRREARDEESDEEVIE
jgi:hypothetical protein